MRIMIEQLFISVDLSMVSPNKDQYCESQLGHYILVWKDAGCNILKRGADAQDILNIRPLSGVSN